jgi:hypothetical protein
MFATHTLFTLALAELMKRRGLFFLHAGCVSIEGQGAILPGQSGKGKSTLTLALVRKGFDFLGDDVVFLARHEQSVRALSFPDEVDVTDTTVSFFPELRAIAGTRRPDWPKQQIQVPDLYGVTPARQCIPRVIVFPTIAPGQKESWLEPVGKDETCSTFEATITPTEPTSTQAHRDVIKALARSCDCYRIHLGADWIERAPELIREALAKAPQ